MKNFYVVLGTLLILLVACLEAGSGVHSISRRDNEVTEAPEVKKEVAEDQQAQQDNLSVNDANDNIQPKHNETNRSKNETDPTGKSPNSGIPYLFNTNSDVVKRMMYVLVGVTAIVVVYFVFRAVRLRRKRSKSKKYGVLTTPGGDMEMAPLDQEDEEDDMTVFDVNNTR